MSNNKEWTNKLWYMHKPKYYEIIKITFLKIFNNVPNCSKGNNN